MAAGILPYGPILRIVGYGPQRMLGAGKQSIETQPTYRVHGEWCHRYLHDTHGVRIFICGVGWGGSGGGIYKILCAALDLWTLNVRTHDIFAGYQHGGTDQI